MGRRQDKQRREEGEGEGGVVHWDGSQGGAQAGTGGSRIYLRKCRPTVSSFFFMLKKVFFKALFVNFFFYPKKTTNSACKKYSNRSDPKSAVLRYFRGQYQGAVQCLPATSYCTVNNKKRTLQ